jgi:hypothetical protein
MRFFYMELDDVGHFFSEFIVASLCRTQANYARSTHDRDLAASAMILHGDFLIF